MQDLKLKVNGKEYIVEFGFRATQCKELNSVFDFITGKTMLNSLAKVKESDTKEQKQMAAISASIETMAEANIYIMDFLFMGLVKYHGLRGKITQDILTKEDAIDLYEDFIEENPEHELANTLGLLEALKSKMESDGFFKLTGADKMMEAMTEPEQSQTQTNISDIKEQAKKAVRKTSTKTKA